MDNFEQTEVIDEPKQEVAPKRAQSRPEQVLEYIREHPGLTTKEIADALGVTPQTVYSNTNKLRARNSIKSIVRGNSTCHYAGDYQVMELPEGATTDEIVVGEKAVTTHILTAEQLQAMRAKNVTSRTAAAKYTQAKAYINRLNVGEAAIFEMAKIEAYNLRSRIKDVTKSGDKKFAGSWNNNILIIERIK